MLNLKKLKKEWLIVLAILVIAGFFRFYHLDSTPPGLWPDEAANGVDALKAIDSGNYKIFYPANNGREGLFINLQAISIRLFGISPFALRLVSAIIGTLTILGLYLLTKHLFDRKTAYIASFFMAISFWHVNFSRIGFLAIMLPFIMVFAFYFLWRGLRNGRLEEFFVAGILGGLGFYTYFSYRIVPLIAIILFLNYWYYLKKDFLHSKYEHARNQLLRGFALLTLTVIVIAIPLGLYFYSHPGDFLKREGHPIAVFAQEQPFKELFMSTVETLGMFTFNGDYNQRHNIPGSTALALPIALFFAIGFIREAIHWLSRKHSHLSPLHTFMFSWFFVMLLPGFLSTEAPHALRTIGAIPIIMIFSAKGFWWLIDNLTRLHRGTDPHAQFDPKIYRRESKLLIGSTIIVLLFSAGLLEYYRYFIEWGPSPATKQAFTQSYVDISSYINHLNPILKKFVLVNQGDVMVDGVPNDAQTIKFLTGSFDNIHSSITNIYYLLPNQLSTFKFPTHYIIIPMGRDTELEKKLINNFGLFPQLYGTFITLSK